MSEAVPILTTETIRIRPAMEHDRSAILALMRPRDYNRINLRPRCFLVATTTSHSADNVAPAVIGIGQIKRHWDGTAELASLVVAAQWRRQRIGGLLVNALVARHFGKAGDHHIQPVAVDSRASAEPLYLFCLSTLESYYRQFGFHQIERYQLPWPLYLMERLGNGAGTLAKGLGKHAFRITAMRIDATL